MAKRKVIITKQEALKDLIDSVDNWDLETVINHAKYYYGWQLERYSLEQLKMEYMEQFNMLDNDDNETLEIIDTKASKILYSKG